MKLFLHLSLAAVWAITGLQLSAQNSSLIVFDEVREDFTLIVNGTRINPTPAQHVRLTGLKPSHYKVEAVFVNAALPRQAMTISVQAGREVSYALSRSTLAGPLEFMFLSEFSTGYLPIAPQGVVTLPYTGPLTDPSAAPAQPTPVQPAPVVVVEKPNPLPGYTGPIGCPSPMEKPAFEEAKKSVASKSFSDTKMQLAQQITRSNCLLTTQVKDFMALFSFESQKLEFAKFAYDFTYDKGNYYKVNDAFSFESSVRELEKHLQGK